MNAPATTPAAAPAAAPGAGPGRPSTVPTAHRVAALAVGLLCFAAYAAMAATGPFWLDSSEFAAAAFSLGVAHPPGHPLAQLVGKAAALVPLGPVALRVAIAQAACGALAAALVARIGAALARRARRALAPGSDGSAGGGALLEALGGAAAGLGFGLCHAAALQAVRPEVYALHAALGLWAVLELVRFDDDGDPRRPLRAALALGLGLCNHHFLTVLLGGAAALFVATQHERVRAAGWARLVVALVAAAALGLSVYAYLPLRALRHPEVDWGAPYTLERFAWTVSARAFQRSLGRAAVGGGPEVALALLRELGWLWPLALGGLALLLAARPLRRLGLLLLLGTLLVAAAPALVGFDRDNPDAYGYLEVAVGLLFAAAALVPASLAAAWAARGATAVAAARGAKPMAAARLGLGAGVVALGLAAVGGATRLPSLSLARFDDTARVGEAILDETPPRGLLVSSYYQTVFPLWYLRVVEGQRPDVDHVHRHFLAWPGYRDEVLRRRPELAPLLGPRDVEPRALLALSRRRPVRLEYDLDLDPSLAARLVPGAFVEALDGPAAPPGDGGGPAVRARLDLGEPETLRFVFWRAFLEAHRDCMRGERAAAQGSIARARSLLGGLPDPDLEELARRCQP